MFKFKAQNGIVYTVKDEKKELWKLADLKRTPHWPLLPIGINGKLIACDVQRLKPINGEQYYLVYRKDNGTRIKPNKKALD